MVGSLAGMAAKLAKLNPGAGSNFSVRMLGGFTGQQMQDVMKGVGLYLGSTLAGQLMGQLNAKPGAVVGNIPLFEVQKVEAAKSDKQLKFRSIGGQFFAFQEGDNTGLRIDCLLSGPLRGMYLTMLDTLYLKGLGRLKNREMLNKTPGSPLEGTLGSALTDPGAAIQGYRSVLIGNANMVSSTPPIAGGLVNPQSHFTSDPIQLARKTWKKIGPNKANPTPTNTELSETPMKEIEPYVHRDQVIMHKTFAVITEEEIFINMYIENFMWSKGVGENGMDDITVHILLRRFVEPPKRFFVDTVEKRWYKTKSNTASTFQKLQYDPQHHVFLKDDAKQVQAAQDYVNNHVFMRHGGYNPNKLPKAVAPNQVKRLKGRKYTDMYDSLDKQDIFARNAGADRKEFLDNLYKEFEDTWESEDVPHRYMGTMTTGNNPGEFNMLALNILWRTYWIGNNLMAPLLSGSGVFKIGSDPIVSRVMMIARTCDVNNVNTANNAMGNSEQHDFSLPLLADTPITEKDAAQQVFSQLGFDTDNVDEISDVLQCPSRQKHLNNVITKGCKIEKLTGTVVIERGELQFNSPTTIIFRNCLRRAPYSAGCSLKMNIAGSTYTVVEGGVTFLGTPPPPSWSVDGRGYYIINKNVYQESYVYVKSVDLIGDKATITALLIYPSRGI